MTYKLVREQLVPRPVGEVSRMEEWEDDRIFDFRREAVERLLG
jgi:hypothetical protein